MKFLKKMLLVGVILNLPFIFAHETGSSSSEKLLKIVNEQVELLDSLKSTLLRKNKPRVHVIEKSIQLIKDNIQENIDKDMSAITLKTLRLIRELIIQYRFSKNFFGWTEPINPFSIHTISTADTLQNLHESYRLLQETFGIDDSPYTMITRNTFKQMRKLLEELEQLPIETELKQFFRDILPSIGTTIALADSGDRPCTYNAASRVVVKIRNKYKSLNKITNSSTGFNMVMEFTGLTEFYAELAQVDRQSIIGVCDIEVDNETARVVQGQ